MEKATLGICFLILMAMVLPAPAAQPDLPADPINLRRTSMPVIFRHEVHAARNCEECHHSVDGHPSYLSCVTEGCHDLLGQRERSARSYYRIAHERITLTFNSCLSCHTTVAAGKPELKKRLTNCRNSACHP